MASEFDGAGGTHVPEDNEDTWVPDDALRALQMERDLSPSETQGELANRIFRENAPAAAASIVHTALHGTNERIRLDAAKYTVERLLGRVGDGNPSAAANPLDAFINALENAANGK